VVSLATVALGKKRRNISSTCRAQQRGKGEKHNGKLPRWGGRDLRDGTYQPFFPFRALAVIPAAKKGGGTKRKRTVKEASPETVVACTSFLFYSSLSVPPLRRKGRKEGRRGGPAKRKKEGRTSLVGRHTLYL